MTVLFKLIGKIRHQFVLAAILLGLFSSQTINAESAAAPDHDASMEILTNVHHAAGNHSLHSLPSETDRHEDCKDDCKLCPSSSPTNASTRIHLHFSYFDGPIISSTWAPVLYLPSTLLRPPIAA